MFANNKKKLYSCFEYAIILPFSITKTEQAWKWPMNLEQDSFVIAAVFFQITISNLLSYTQFIVADDDLDSENDDFP